MIILIVAGVFFIVVGIGMIVMPKTTRKLDRFDNQLRGRQSHQGDAYEAGRIGRGMALIVAGIVMLLLPFLVFDLLG